MNIGAIKLALILILAVAPLAGCVTFGGSGLELYCGVDGKPGLYVPVQLSHKDTQGTIDQTRANNAVHDTLCR